MKKTFTELRYIVVALFSTLVIWHTPFLTLSEGCNLNGTFLLIHFLAGNDSFFPLDNLYNFFSILLSIGYLE
jgi:hypothetical protein